MAKTGKTTSISNLHPDEERNFSLWIWAFGLISTLFSYKFGISDQIEQLPIIMRSMDAAYLQNDFFVNASQGFGPRYYYSLFVGEIAAVVGLKWAIFLLTLLSNLFLSLTSFRAASSLFANPKAGLFGAAMVMGMSTYEMGSDLVMYGAYLTPGLLVSPFVMGSMWMAWEGRYLQAAFLAGLASVFHVLYGLETGLLVLGAAFFANIFNKNYKEILPIIGAGGILVLFSLLTLIPYLQLEKSLDDQLFIDIIASFRHPHHYLPSYISRNLFDLSLFFLSVGILFFAFRNKLQTIIESKLKIRWFYAFGSLLLLSLLAGWLFVEIIPNRLFVTAQLWRLLNLFKWLFLILLGGMLAVNWDKMEPSEKILNLLAHISPLTMWYGHLNFSNQDKFRMLARILLCLSFGLLLYFSITDLFSFDVVFLSLVYAFCLGLILMARSSLSIAFLSLLVIFFFCQMTFLPGVLPEAVQKLSNRILKPSIFEAPYSEESLAFSGFMKENLPEEAIVLSPPGFGALRVEGRRALVVDFKAFPFGDGAIIEWYNRVNSFYGNKPAIQTRNMDELKSQQKEFYNQLSPAQLKLLRQKYPFDYAILPAAKYRNSNGLFEFGDWKLVNMAKL
ncbi:MAG: hypothetical protein MRZ79_24920 [Bacteroidia bacterium]|nr:hypothetical protein [Bacteroidia bacterium]